MSRSTDPFALSLSSWRLMVDASAVVTLRMARLSQCDAGALIESQRMVSEKLVSGTVLMMKAWSGALGQTPAVAASRTIAHFRPEVARNRRRLSGKSSRS